MSSVSHLPQSSVGFGTNCFWLSPVFWANVLGKVAPTVSGPIPRVGLDE